MPIFQLAFCFVLSFVAVGLSGELIAQEVGHEHVQTVEDGLLANVVAVRGTKDGKFIYTCGFDPGSLLCFGRDAATGELTKVHSYDENGLVDLDISTDQNYIAACSFMSNSVILYKRNTETGEVEKVSTLDQTDHEFLQTPVSVKISPDGKFVYLTASGGKRLLVFTIKEDQLELLQEHEGVGECLSGGRVISTDPTGKFLYIASHTAGTISMFERDEETGKVEMFKHIMDDSIYGALLGGAHGTVVSRDGKNLYVVSGRFNGDDAVTAFKIKEDNDIKMIQEFENNVELDGFTGGNHISVSPDGKFLYASGATSENLALFKRSTETGKLEFMNYLDIDGESQLGMTAGIHVSEDNQFVYIGGEGAGKVYVFKRSEK